MKSRIFSFSFFAFICILSLPSFAAGTYNFAQVELGEVNDDDSGGTLLSLNGALELNNHFYIAGGIANGDYDSADVQDLMVGVGLTTDLSPELDIYFELLHQERELDWFGGTNKSNGMRKQLGLRYFPREKLELHAEYLSLNLGNGTSDAWILGGNLYVTSNFALGLDYLKADETDVFNLTIRFGQQ